MLPLKPTKTNFNQFVPNTPPYLFIYIRCIIYIVWSTDLCCLLTSVEWLPEKMLEKAINTWWKTTCKIKTKSLKNLTWICQSAKFDLIKTRKHFASYYYLHDHVTTIAVNWHPIAFISRLKWAYFVLRSTRQTITCIYWEMPASPWMKIVFYSPEARQVISI